MPRVIRVGDKDNHSEHPSSSVDDEMRENDSTMWVDGGGAGSGGSADTIRTNRTTIRPVEVPPTVAASGPEDQVNDRTMTNDQVPAEGPLSVNQPQNVGGAVGGVDPNTGQPVTPQISATAATTAAASDIVPFLQQVLAEANSGQWEETRSNPKIVNIWVELGFPNTPFWRTDSTPWCMGFVNWVLKRTGYRWVQTANADDIRSRASDFRATQIPLSQGRPGDICLWSYGHVNFIYTAQGSTYTFVGGNQSSRTMNNGRPSTGSVTLSWPNGYRVPGNNTLVGIWRPSRS